MIAALKSHIVRSILFVAVFLLFTFHLSLVTSYAGSGLVSQIGGATFIQGASQFWVTSSKPTFSGVTSANASVSGTVGSQVVSATADSSGNWSWTPTTDLSGDNPVTITSGSTTVSFTLTIGQVPANIATAGGTTLAPAGTTLPVVIFLVGGISLLLIGVGGLAKSFRQ